MTIRKIILASAAFLAFAASAQAANTSSVVQNGDGNLASTHQLGKSNDSQIVQFGNDNGAGIHQRGGSNNAGIGQNGNNNEARVHQRDF